MNILSLFDGISCGQLALKKAGIHYDNYYASEIDKTAIQITQTHFPDTIQLGDVTNISYKNGVVSCSYGTMRMGKIDLLIGGSPCTDMSFIGTKRGMISENTEITSLEQYLSLKNKTSKFQGQSYLFWEYVRILNEIKPKYFLLENVRMNKKWEDIISDAIGVSPIPINSSLFSAQNRPRLYWTNIPNINIPADKGVILDDVLEHNESHKDVSYTKTVQKALPILQEKYGYIPQRFNAYNTSKIQDKARALTAGGSPITSTCATLMFEEAENGVHTIKSGILNGEYEIRLEDGRYNIRCLTTLEMERLQTLPDNYTNINGISKNKRRHAIGNGWTVDVIAYIFKFIK